MKKLMKVRVIGFPDFDLNPVTQRLILVDFCNFRFEKMPKIEFPSTGITLMYGPSAAEILKGIGNLTIPNNVILYPGWDHDRKKLPRTVINRFTHVANTLDDLVNQVRVIYLNSQNNTVGQLLFTTISWEDFMVMGDVHLFILECLCETRLSDKWPLRISARGITHATRVMLGKQEMDALYSIYFNNGYQVSLEYDGTILVFSGK